MTSLKARAEALGRTEAELRLEMAEALGRISRVLSQSIGDLQRLRSEYPNASGQERARMVREYQETHSRAKEYFWYLMVQREAIGIRNHQLLAELYPIPSRDLR